MHGNADTVISESSASEERSTYRLSQSADVPGVHFNLHWMSTLLIHLEQVSKSNITLSLSQVHGPSCHRPIDEESLPARYEMDTDGMRALDVLESGMWVFTIERLMG